MADILHKIGCLNTTTDAVADALTTVDGLSRWWTNDTTGDAAEGGELQFRFPAGGFDMKVVDVRPGQHVGWQVVDGPEEWVGTTIDWDLRQDGDNTTVLFAHRGWREPVEFMHHCSTKWGVYLLSLKSLVEDGQGSPSPDDVKIDSWD
jgi:uncharacterized protein YndB with AHSA1/START domain